MSFRQIGRTVDAVIRRPAVKRLLFALSLLLLVCAVPAFARTIIIVDEVIRMTKAGVDEGAIVAYVHKYGEPFQINGDDVIAMNEAHVPPAVFRAVIDESGARMRA